MLRRNARRGAIVAWRGRTRRSDWPRYACRSSNSLQGRWR